MWKGREKNQKFVETERRFFDEIKGIFCNSANAFLSWNKKKSGQKISVLLRMDWSFPDCFLSSIHFHPSRQSVERKHFKENKINYFFLATFLLLNLWATNYCQRNIRQYFFTRFICYRVPNSLSIWVKQLNLSDRETLTNFC